jgi:hypothetical protein
MHTHEMLMEAHTKGMTKRPYQDEDNQYLPSQITSGNKLENTKKVKQEIYLRSEYPLVKYWTKQQWKDAENCNKNASDPLASKDKTCGGTQSARGENIMMLYIENFDGMPIDGAMATQIREHARIIWRDLHQRGQAPEKWTDASREVRNEYFREMEEQYEVLWYCDNHWKANKLAMTFYSIWLTRHNKKGMKSQKDNPHEGRLNKKARTTNTDSEDKFRGSPKPDGQTTRRVVSHNPTEDIDGAEPELGPPLCCIQTENRPPTSQASSRPKPRPLKDPL